MNSRSIKYMKVSIIILVVFVLLWGLFYFANNNKKTLVSENKELSQDISLTDKQIDDTSTEIEEEKNFIEEKEFVEENVEIIKENKETVDRDSLSDSDKEIKKNLVSWGFTPSSGRVVDTIVLHSSYNALGGDEYDLGKLIDEYKEYGVAPHYLIDRKGDIYRLVEDKNIAYHAGVSKVPDGRTNVNGFSIGIELMNTKEDNYKKDQYEAVNWLIEKLEKDYNIKYILGHNEIAPERKTDPWNINWDKINR